MLHAASGFSGVRRPGPGRAPTTRAGQQHLREHNLCLVFSHIAAADPDHLCSRASLAHTTGLTRATVSSLVASLIESNLVTELPPSIPRQAGRPATPLAVASGTVAGLGLEINVDYLGVRAIDLTGAKLGDGFQAMNLRQSDPLSAVDALLSQTRRLVTALEDRKVHIIGACLALPGIADHPTGPLRLAPNLGWAEVDIRHLLGAGIDELEGVRHQVRRTMQSVLVDRLLVGNEANLAARTEIGQHQDRSFIYVSGQIGIGAAIVVDGEVFSGLHGWAGEIGHIVIDGGGPQCACGARGCLEVYAGKRSLLLAAGLDGEEDIATLGRAVDNGDPRAMAAVDRAADALGIALANCINLVDVSRVILGGAFAVLADSLQARLGTQLATHVLSSRWMTSDLDIRASTGGPYAATTGGALAVLDQAITDPSSPMWGTPGEEKPAISEVDDRIADR